MSILRPVLLAASQNQWLRERATKYGFVRRSVSRFMPGETLDDALEAAAALKKKKIGATLTHLGENVADRAEAQQVREHYLEVLRRIRAQGIDTEISLKLTQLGLDLSDELCFEHLKAIIAQERPESTVWIDMEASNYVDATLALYRRALETFPNVGICLQAYLYRTAKDIEDLLGMRPSIRLVKGAYKEPPEVAFQQKSEVDQNYVRLMMQLLLHGNYPALATHDEAIINAACKYARDNGIDKASFEFQMLYGIRRDLQQKLVSQSYNVRVYVPYGSQWYPYLMRRMAERPANLMFVMSNAIRR